MNSQEEFSLFDILSFVLRKKVGLLMIFLVALILSLVYFYFTEKKEYKATAVIAVDINDSIQTDLGNTVHLFDHIQEFTPLLYNQKVFNQAFQKINNQKHNKNKKVTNVLKHELFREQESTGKGILLTLKLADSSTHLILDSYWNKLKTEVNVIYLKNVLNRLQSDSNLKLADYMDKTTLLKSKLANMKKQKDSITSGYELSDVPLEGQVLMTFSDIVNPNYIELENEIIKVENKILMLQEKSNLIKGNLNKINNLREQFITSETTKEPLPEQYRFFSNSSSMIQISDQSFLIGFNPIIKTLISSFVALLLSIVVLTIRHIYLRK